MNPPKVTSVTTSEDAPPCADFTHPEDTLWGVRIVYTLADGSTRRGEIRAGSGQAVRARVRALNSLAAAGDLTWKDGTP